MAQKLTEPDWSLTTLLTKLVKIGAKGVSHGCNVVAFQLAEVAVLRQLFAQTLSLIAWLRAPPTPA